MPIKVDRLLQGEVEGVLEGGIRRNSPHLTLVYKRAQGENRGKNSRFTVVVSKKTAPLATKRNTIKRRVRPLARILLSSFSAPYDVVFFAKTGVGKLSPYELQKEIENLLSFK
jgi:ribonuclease P protein component